MAASFSIAFTPAIPIGGRYVIAATRQFSAGVLVPPKRGYKTLAVLNAVSSPYDALAAYNAVFGPLTSGSRIFIRMYAITAATGLASAMLETSVVVT